jgi:hypothetical protein
VRVLAGWPDASAVPHLMTLAKAQDNTRHHVLAVRGLARLAARQADQPADLEMLAEIMSLAQRAEEKRIVLGVLASAATVDALELVTTAMDDPDLAEEAAAAAVTIAQEAIDRDEDKIRAAMEKAQEKSSVRMTRTRAQQVLESL